MAWPDRGVTLRPLTGADLPLLARWIAAPHVARWWSEDPAGTESHYRPTIAGEDRTRVEIVQLHGEPVGMVQSYDHRDEPGWDRAIGIERAVGIDYLIGETSALRQGVGTAAIRAAAARVLYRHPAADVVVAAPQAANAASCRTLERAGFVLLDRRMLDTDDPSDAGLASVYVWRRPPADPGRWSDGVAMLDEAYAAVDRFLADADTGTLTRGSRCAGWSVRDVLVHVLDDATRALQALATPSLGPADRDAVSYWRDLPPPLPGSDGAATDVPRGPGEGWSLARLRAGWHAGRTAAIAGAGAADPRGLVQTQGHVLGIADFLDTLILEATVHLLDVSGSPGGRALASTVGTFDALTGGPLPDWDVEAYLLRASGRIPLDAADAVALGDRAAAYPAFG